MNVSMEQIQVILDFAELLLWAGLIYFVVRFSLT